MRETLASNKDYPFPGNPFKAIVSGHSAASPDIPQSKFSTKLLNPTLSLLQPDEMASLQEIIQTMTFLFSFARLGASLGAFISPLAFADMLGFCHRSSVLNSNFLCVHPAFRSTKHGARRRDSGQLSAGMGCGRHARILHSAGRHRRRSRYMDNGEAEGKGVGPCHRDLRDYLSGDDLNAMSIKCMEKQDVVETGWGKVEGRRRT